MLLPLFWEIATNFFIKGYRIALICYCHFFGKSITSFFHKRRRAGILPLTSYKPQKSRMDGLSGKNFSGGSFFPDNKAFRKLRFARCLKKWQSFLASLSNTELLGICQKWAQKKQQIFFGFTALCAAAGRRLFSYKIANQLFKLRIYPSLNKRLITRG